MSPPSKIDKTRADQDAITFTPARKYMDDKTTAEAVTMPTRYLQIHFTQYYNCQSNKATQFQVSRKINHNNFMLL